MKDNPKIHLVPRNNEHLDNAPAGNGGGVILIVVIVFFGGIFFAVGYMTGSMVQSKQVYLGVKK